MTLKEKFENCPDKDGWINKNHSRAVNLEKIADEFAIGFAEFMMNFDYYKTKKLWIRNNIVSTDKFTTKELLEIYKKEKGS
jgi:hypothetical protein